MKRFAILFGCFALLASPALATSDFNKMWKEKYISGDDANEDLKKTARKHGCYICHVSGEKKDVRNEYGKAVHKYLKAEDFPKDWIKDNPEEARKKIFAGLDEAAKEKSKDGDLFGDKMKAGKVPATDSGKD
ncbi:hypothetical protein [Rhodopirellula sp. MGV]|uniref:hypothetical protein n=1 Tax=Rhodopirellula sp. MGV TaxID=2023130 RepID=UPI000B978E72|nr:hypothetical protein [Rhodopirellula sp. MGV]OYP28975.1 hypothetical protein CGZ80_25800 [Rhodopirellula sp. MGV]PNY34961.1 hypothetical protein C2E31_20615 [Rhodopirellula baltica]